MEVLKDAPLAEGEVECVTCKARYVPDMGRDYYHGKNNRDGKCEVCVMRELSEPVAIAGDDPRLDALCKKGQGAATCRYLSVGSSGFACMKTALLRSAIDRRSGSMEAQGDNCSGPSSFEPTAV